MRSWQKAIAIAMAMVASGGVTAAWAQVGPSSHNTGPATAAPRPASRDLGAGTTEDRYVGITPCRLADTRLGSGPVQPGTLHAFAVRGSGGLFAGQGGKPGGCGIPLSASSIEGTITAVAASGTGFLRVFPTGSPPPTATFLNYIAGFNPTNTGALTLGPAEDSLGVQVFGSSTQVVVDVVGYFVKPLAAVVSGDGTLSRGSRVVSSVLVAPGAYNVGFDRNISSCAFTADVGVTGNSGDISGEATTSVSSSDATKVFVRTNDSAGTQTSKPFHLVVTC
ncbi:MAG: hypothetical protein JWN46_218 [Acidimicrobiales bacterium]|nr:hypothetical protein [Acidimicrobiales bacterium]